MNSNDSCDETRSPLGQTIIATVSAGYGSNSFSDNIYATNIKDKRLSPNLAYYRAIGKSMTGKGINDGSLLLVKHTTNVRPNDTIIANVDGELLVKTFKVINNTYILASENPDFNNIGVLECQEFSIIGKVIDVINDSKLN